MRTHHPQPESCRDLHSPARRAREPSATIVTRQARRRPHRHRALTILLAAAATAVLAAPLAHGARAARTVTLNDTAHLRLTSHHGFTLNERGTATGTIAGTIYIHLTVSSTNRVTAEVNIYPHAGSITGRAGASYRAAGPTATFTGTMNILRGTGTYRHASGHALSFTGTIRRTDDAITVRVSGRMST